MCFVPSFVILAQWFWRRRILNFINVFLLFQKKMKNMKILQTTDGQTDDGRQVIRKAHLSFKLRWSKNTIPRYKESLWFRYFPRIMFRKIMMGTKKATEFIWKGKGGGTLFFIFERVISPCGKCENSIAYRQTNDRQQVKRNAHLRIKLRWFRDKKCNLIMTSITRGPWATSLTWETCKEGVCVCVCYCLWSPAGFIPLIETAR